MTLDEYNDFCASLPSTTHVVQWGGAHVWKVGGKVFAIGGWSNGQTLAVTFKVSDLAYDILKEQPGCRPAPYLASRGMKWIQRFSDETMDDAALKDYLGESLRLVALKLPKAARRELGLMADRAN
jgi:predicted DNA-binding protein (MmcQ/YjbR family)